MAITPIPNQPVNFKNIAAPAECACMGQEFSQLVNKDDQTQFQIKADQSNIENGDFEDDLTGWDIYYKLLVAVSITNESLDGECDGQVSSSVTGGSGGLTYSIDGGVFGGSNVFTGLCAGTHIITAKDLDGNTGSVSFEVFTNVICGDHKGDTIQDLIDAGITLGQLYNCTLNDLKP